MLWAGTPASAQLLAAREGPVVYGHHHINASDVDAHRKFWIDALGGQLVQVGTSSAAIVKFPNVFVMLSARAPSGGTKGSSVNHLGFQVPDLRAAVNRAKAAGASIVTRAELPPQIEVTDGLGFIADQNTHVAFLMGPDDTKVELFENKQATRPIALHHVHFATPDVDAMRGWYAKTFGAAPGVRGSFQAADLPGVNLTFSSSAEPVAATRGRSLDHIGFEVKGLEEFVRRLQASGIKMDREVTKVPALGLSIAFLTDPWGTYIELTEGFAAVP
jgi:catechol 2,3-dioxygenase-like lactoylglutathione lyase family enzyme